MHWTVGHIAFHPSSLIWALDPLQLTQSVARIYYFSLCHDAEKAERHRTERSRWAKTPCRREQPLRLALILVPRLLPQVWSVDRML